MFQFDIISTENLYLPKYNIFIKYFLYKTCKKSNVEGFEPATIENLQIPFHLLFFLHFLKKVFCCECGITFKKNYINLISNPVVTYKMKRELQESTQMSFKKVQRLLLSKKTKIQ